MPSFNHPNSKPTTRSRRQFTTGPHFTLDAGYGPTTPALQSTESAGVANRTDADQSAWTRSTPEQSAGERTWETGKPNADLPTEPGPSGAKIPTDTFAQPSTQRFREIVARFSTDGVAYYYVTHSAGDGTGDYVTDRHTVKTSEVDEVDRHASEGFRYQFSGDIDSNGDYAVVKSPRNPNDLGKVSNWSADAAKPARDKLTALGKVNAETNRRNRELYK